MSHSQVKIINGVKTYVDPFDRDKSTVPPRAATKTDPLIGVPYKPVQNGYNTSGDILQSVKNLANYYSPQLADIGHKLRDGIYNIVNGVGDFVQKNKEVAAGTYVNPAKANLTNKLVNYTGPEPQGNSVTDNGNAANVGEDINKFGLSTYGGASEGASLGAITPDSTPEDDAAAVVEAENYLSKLQGAWDAEVGEVDEWKEKELAAALTNYEAVIALLEEKYGNMMKLLKSEKSMSEQSAAINHQKLLKYLPEQLKSMGLGSLGTSQSAFLKAYNNYHNQLSEASRDYRKGSMEAENAYNSSLASAMQQYNSNRLNITSQADSRYNNLRNYYGGLIADEKERAYNDKIRNEELTRYNDKLAFDNYIDILETTGFETPEDVDNFLKGIKGTISDAYYYALMSRADIYKSLITKTEAEEKEAAEEEASLLGKSKSVTVKKNVGKAWGYENDTVKLDLGDSGTAKVTLGTRATDIEALETVKDIESDTVFMYDGELYYKTEDGKVVTVEKTQKYGKLYNYLNN